MIAEVAYFDGTPAQFQARTAAFDRRLWAKYKPPFPRLGMLIYQTGPAAPPNATEVTVGIHPEATLEEAVNRPMSDGTVGRWPVIAEQTKASITAVALASGSQLELVCIEAAWPIVQEHWRRLLVELGSAPAEPKSRGASRLKDREPEEWKIKAAIIYQDERAKGILPTPAAQLAGISDYRTAEGWIEAWSDHIERERMKRK